MLVSICGINGETKCLFIGSIFTDLPGWPLLTPLKVQLQKCEKCSREFCSPINYRRHIRVHRRSLNVDKVFLLLVTSFLYFISALVT